MFRDGRQPVSYIADYGDCLGGDSLLNVTCFGAAYYNDKMMIGLRPGGTTLLTKDDVMMFACVCNYGEPRSELISNSCDANRWRYIQVVRSCCTVLTADVLVHSNPRFPSKPQLSYQSAYSISTAFSILLSRFRTSREAVLRIFFNTT